MLDGVVYLKGNHLFRTPQLRTGNRKQTRATKLHGAPINLVASEGHVPLLE